MDIQNNIYGFIVALEIFSEFEPNQLQETSFLEAEHNIFSHHIRADSRRIREWDPVDRFRMASR